jgi:ubiquinone/menaquinone biosynthesis C-methylase UbiE
MMETNGMQKSIATVAELRRHRGEYGFDGALPTVLSLMAVGAGGLILTGLAFIRARSGRVQLAVVDLLAGLLMLQALPSYLYSTRRGKFAVWAELLSGLQLRGDERVLDLGCGRGATLSVVAKAVPSGRAVGVDLWRTQDQSGNSLETAWRNLDIEGVRERCEIRTGDMRALPFPDYTFDLVVSSLAIHNIKGQAERLKAIDEAVRVLKPGGRLLITDLMWTGTYARRLRECGMESVVEKQLDWRFWYGALGMATGLVTATKPDLIRGPSQQS